MTCQHLSFIKIRKVTFFDSRLTLLISFFVNTYITTITRAAESLEKEVANMASVFRNSLTWPNFTGPEYNLCYWATELHDSRSRGHIPRSREYSDPGP